jgi:hypothetical protein
VRSADDLTWLLTPTAMWRLAISCPITYWLPSQAMISSNNSSEGAA